MSLFRLLSGTLFSGCFLVVALLLAGCKKNQQFKEESAQTSVDHRHAVAEMDEVIKDINTVIMEQFTLRGRVSSAKGPTTSVCGVKPDSLGMLTGKMTLTYDGTECYGRTRTGQVIFSIVQYPLRKWKQKDCEIRIEYKNYLVKRGSSARTIKIEGVQTLKNETGGTWFELWYAPGNPSCTYRHSGTDVKITFNSDKTSYFSVDRRLQFTHAGGITSCQVSGLSAQKGRGNVEAWGISTNNDNFAAEVTSPYTWKTSCGAVAPLKGAVSIAIDGKEFDLDCRYGVDSQGNTVAENSGTCPFGWEVTWSRKKRTNSRLFGYY